MIEYARPCPHDQTYVAVTSDTRCVSCGAHLRTCPACGEPIRNSLHTCLDDMNLIDPLVEEVAKYLHNMIHDRDVTYVRWSCFINAQEIVEIVRNGGNNERLDS